MPSDLLAVFDDSRAVEAYDPTRGMQRIAVAEAAERMFARARDATQLFAAIEHRLFPLSTSVFAAVAVGFPASLRPQRHPATPVSVSLRAGIRDPRRATRQPALGDEFLDFAAVVP